MTTLSLSGKHFSLGEHRINKPSEFNDIFAYKVGVTGNYLKIIGKPQDDRKAPVRIAFIVSKKIAKRSHDRNYMKRVLREITRHHQKEFQGLDIIYRVTKAYRKEEHLFSTIQEEVLTLRQDLSHRIHKKQRYLYAIAQKEKELLNQQQKSTSDEINKQ